MASILKPKAPRPDPATNYVALMGAVCKAGPITEGNTYHGDDPRVAAALQFFVPEGTTEEERYRARYALRTPPPASSDLGGSSVGAPIRTGRPAPASELVVAIAAVGPVGPSNHPTAPVPQGAVVPRSHPAVKARPKAFRPATEADVT